MKIKALLIIFVIMASSFYSCQSTFPFFYDILDFAYFGQTYNSSWTISELKGKPNQILEKLPQSSNNEESANIFFYVTREERYGRVKIKADTWYQVYAEGKSVYFIYKYLIESGEKWQYIVYKSKGSFPVPNPTITPEEFKKVELAYKETEKYIQNRGKHLYINNLSDRNALIRKYGGRPETDKVRAAKDIKLEWFDIRKTSQEDIVALAKREKDVFTKVRMIHDWVADVFAYDYDLLWWINSVSGKNAEFTLKAIIERQRGVCYEYSLLFWFLLDATGVDTYLISDFSKSGVGHAYNMVVINNTGYIIDTTWDSGNKYELGKMKEHNRLISKNYFMPDINQSYKLRGW